MDLLGVFKEKKRTIIVLLKRYSLLIIRSSLIDWVPEGLKRCKRCFDIFIYYMKGEGAVRAILWKKGEFLHGFTPEMCTEVGVVLNAQLLGDLTVVVV